MFHINFIYYTYFLKPQIISNSNCFLLKYSMLQKNKIIDKDKINRSLSQK